MHEVNFRHREKNYDRTVNMISVPRVGEWVCIDTLYARVKTVEWFINQGANGRAVNIQLENPTILEEIKRS